MRSSHRRSFLVLALSLALGASVLPASATGRPRTADRGVAANGILRGDLAAASGAPMAFAARALREHADALSVDPARFRFETVRRSIVGVHVRGREFRGGVPVAGTSVAVHAVEGRVWQVEARASSLPGGPARAARRRGPAVAAALGALGVRRPLVPPAAERVLVPDAGRLRDAWRVHVFAPEVAAAVLVDAARGTVVRVEDRNRYAEGTATVFDPNPIVTAHNPALRQPGVDEQGFDTDLDSAALTAQLRTLRVREYDAGGLALGRLAGPWASVQGPLPLIGPSFAYTKSDPRFETAMVYVHVDHVQRYLQSLGFTGAAGVNAEPQDAYALPILGFDNSFYQPGNDLMAFGAGGVDDAEDAEVIVHEYGHAIHDAQVPGWGEHHEGGSMGEGFGDFLAAAFYGRSSGGFQDTCIADWDATSYSDAAVACLRPLDAGKRYPADVEDEVHADGEIWSQFLWRVRTLLRCLPKEKGCARRSPALNAEIMTRRVLKLVLTSHEFLSTTADFGDAVAALRTAARALKQPRYDALIVRAARERGLPLA